MFGLGTHSRDKKKERDQAGTTAITPNDELLDATLQSPAASQTSSPSSKKPDNSRVTGRQLIGLFELKPEKTASEPLLSTYHLDVIALHGLNGNAYTTWTNKHNKLWLRDILPHSLPGARIYTFGYNSALFSQSHADIGDFARRLLSELSLVRRSESDKKRGIVFICHSLGGIVCKKALILAHESSEYTNILQSTSAIVFFGTPHSGSKQADLFTILIGIVNTVEFISMIQRTLGKTRKDLVQLLRPRSTELENLSMSFTNRTEDIEIISFFEEKAMPPFKHQLVPRDSARIGVMNEKLLSLPYNHRDMCRLDEGADDYAYKVIEEVCQRHGARSNEADMARPLNLQEQECLRALNTIDMDDCIAQLRPRAPGTCEWILSNDAFREWISDNSSSLLCITGDMGSGKSILMSYLVGQIGPLIDAARHIDSPKVTVSSFFCDDKDVGRKYGQAVLRCLLYQILHQRHDLVEHATARFSEMVPGRWSILTLWEILRDIMLNPITGSVVLIIDAMDECEPTSRDRILTAIGQILAQNFVPHTNCIKVLISSRPKVDLLEQFDQHSRLISLDGKAEIVNVEQDLVLVVKDQLHELASRVHWPKEITEALERGVIMRADRNFLWVRLVIQRLKQGPQNKKHLERIIEESPKDLDGLFCRILTDIDAQNGEFAAKILRVLVGSLRPLTTAELQLALAIDSRHRTLNSVEDDSDMAIERTLRLVLGPLIRIYDHGVHLVHQSAKEFLVRLSTGNVANLKWFQPDLQTMYGTSLNAANLELATACTLFLGLVDFENSRILDENVTAFLELPGATEDSPWVLMHRATDPLSHDSRDSAKNVANTSREQKYPFFEYSASYWTTHLRASGDSVTKHLLDQSIRISRRGTNCLANWSDQYRLLSKDWIALPCGLDPLIVAAFFGLIPLVNEVLHTYTSELQEESKLIALSWACRMGFADIVKALLNRGTPVSGAWVEAGTPLSWACAGGHSEIVKLLLKEAKSSQVNERDGNGRSPLSLAVGSSNLAITQLLIAREDVEVNMADRTGSPPLFWAIGSKSEKEDLTLLQYLVSEPRVNIAQRDRYGRTVLSWAAEMGACDAIRILLDSSRPEVQSLLDDQGDNDRGWTPLSWAAYNGQLGVVKILCATRKINSQLSSVDKRGQNAISLAADRNHGDVIKLLANVYPEGVDRAEESGRTPLSCAMWGSPSNAETVRILLKTGLVDVNRKAVNGRTPLAYAATVGRADLVRILVEEGGADMDILDNDGNAPGDLTIDWRSIQVKKEIDRLRRRRLGGDLHRS